MLGTTVAHYKLVERIGKGGMGVVYKAQDLKLDRFVALKFLPHDLSADGDEKRRLIREAKAASALDHPNICVIHEINESDDGQMFIAMAYYEGEALTELVSRERLPTDRIVDLAAQVARGLVAAHEHGITHRDIKSANVVVTKDGVAKIVDFGLAKLAGKTRLTKAGTIMGTMQYMSPEQIRGEEVDHRADIWALGVVLYEMLTGQLPFRGDYVPALMYSILSEDPEPIDRYRTDITEELKSTVEKALKKDASARFQSVAELLACLGEAEAKAAGPAFRSKAAVSDNLPGQLTDFIGREQEMAQVEALLSSARLVTLTGPGGTGKTRLSLQVASEMRERFENGVLFVPLAAINDPGLVTSTIAAAVGLREAGSKPILESLKEYLRDHHLLLLLDNFEHVVAAAPVTTELLAACPRLKALVTSREPLHVSGELQFPVPPLTVPDPGRLPPTEALSRYEAVVLFVRRALAVKPDFRLTKENAPAVVEICVRLDGLPLAIELAAARIRLLPPQAMLARLADSLGLLTGGPRDLPARQQTLRGAILWSYDLLDTEEKKLFRRLSVFTGGCSLEAAEAVCNGPKDVEIEMLEGVASLVDKNLLQERDQPDGEPRFQMLETIREFGHGCLAASAEDETLRRAHRDFFLRFAEEAEPQLTGRQQALYLERLEREHDNFRSALDWCGTDQNGVAEHLGLVGALWRFWLVHGHLSEGRKLLAKAVARADHGSHTRLLAKALSGEGTLAHNQGDYAAAGTLFEKSLALNRQLNDKPGIAAALNNVGWARWRQCEYAAARSLSEESLALYRELGEKRGIASALVNLGWVNLFQGDYSQARSQFEKGLALRQELGDERSIAFSLCMLGWMELKQGNHGKAASLLEEASASFDELGDRQLVAFTRSLMGNIAQEQSDYRRAAKVIEEESLPLFREIGDRWGIAFALNTLGKAALRQGDHAEARRIHEESLEIRRETKDKWGIAQSLYGLAEAAWHEGDYDRAATCCRESMSLRREMGDRAGTAECLEGMAVIACKQGRLGKATQLFGSAQALRESVSAPLPPCDHAPYDRYAATARTELGEEAFTAAWTQGRTMTPEEAMEHALDG